MRVMGCVRDFTSYLCFLDDIQLRTLVFVDRRKVLWFYRTTNNSKTMETTKEEMMQFLRELQNLQQRLPNSLHEIALIIDLCVFENRIKIDCYTCLFQNISGTSKSVCFCSCSSYEENRTKLNRFTKYVKKLSKYGCEKSKPNQTPT